MANEGVSKEQHIKRCRYVRRDAEQTRCDQPSEYDLRYFYPHEEGQRPHRTHSCLKHLGRTIEITMRAGSCTLTVYRRIQEITEERDH